MSGLGGWTTAARPPTVFEQRRVLERHWELAESLYGPERTGPLLRKFGIKYTGSHPEHLQVRQAFTQIRTRSEWFAVLDQWYGIVQPGVFPSTELHRSKAAVSAVVTDPMGAMGWRYWPRF